MSNPTVEAGRMIRAAATAPCGHPKPCGCQHAECCLECGLPRCKFDVPSYGVLLGAALMDGIVVGLTSHKRAVQERRLRVLQLRRDLVYVKDIAVDVGVTKRTVTNDLRVLREAGLGTYLSKVI